MTRKKDIEVNNPLNSMEIVCEDSKRSRKANKEIINMQLQIAKIVLKDAYITQMQNPGRNFKDIVDELSQNWKDNIKKFTFALMIMEPK